jgi:hypothetical protein
MPDYSKPQITFRVERIKGGLDALLSKLNGMEGVEWEPGLVVAEAGDIVRFVVNDRPQKPEYHARLTATRAEILRGFAEWADNYENPKWVLVTMDGEAVVFMNDGVSEYLKYLTGKEPNVG